MRADGAINWPGFGCSVLVGSLVLNQSKLMEWKCANKYNSRYVGAERYEYMKDALKLFPLFCFFSFLFNSNPCTMCYAYYFLGHSLMMNQLHRRANWVQDCKHQNRQQQQEGTMFHQIMQDLPSDNQPGKEGAWRRVMHGQLQAGDREDDGDETGATERGEERSAREAILPWERTPSSLRQNVHVKEGILFLWPASLPWAVHHRSPSFLSFKYGIRQLISYGAGSTCHAMHKHKQDGWTFNNCCVAAGFFPTTAEKVASEKPDQSIW